MFSPGTYRSLCAFTYMWPWWDQFATRKCPFLIPALAVWKGNRLRPKQRENFSRRHIQNTFSWMKVTDVCSCESDWQWIHDDVFKWKHFLRYWPLVRGNHRSLRPVTWSFTVFFDLRLNKRLSKQSWGWRFETPSRPLWRHCNVALAKLMALYRTGNNPLPEPTMSEFINCDIYLTYEW